MGWPSGAFPWASGEVGTEVCGPSPLVPPTLGSHMRQLPGSVGDSMASTRTFSLKGRRRAPDHGLPSQPWRAPCSQFPELSQTSRAADRLPPGTKR